MAELAPPVHVLTAWNPGELRPELEANRDRNHRLLDRLTTRGVEVHPAIGASPDGDHYEESFATTGLDRTAAIDLGREFEQAAVFELTTREQIVVACEGDWGLSRSLSASRSVVSADERTDDSDVMDTSDEQDSFTTRWTPARIKATCGKAHGAYKKGLEKHYRRYFEERPDLGGNHPWKARDLDAALPPGREDLGSLIPPGGRHPHYLSGGSSQVLAMALLGSTMAEDRTLTWLREVLGLDGTFGLLGPCARFEYALSPHVLNEKPRVTNVDVLVEGESTIICVEAKLWEAGFGSCACGSDPPDPADAEDPELEPTPPQERGACSGRVRDRSLYYRAATDVLGLPERHDGLPCPIAAGYQAIRNIAAARALADGRDAVFALFYDDRNPHFSGEGEWPGWARALTDLASGQEIVSVRTCSWQQLLGSGAVPHDVVDWAREKHGLVPGSCY